MADRRPLRVLLDLRPALEGFSGIPQETRLLFKHLHRPGRVETDGLIQAPHLVLGRGLPLEEARRARVAPHRQGRRLARIVIALTERGETRRAVRQRRRRYVWSVAKTRLSAFFGRPVRLTAFAAENFADFIWRGLFSKSLVSSDRAEMTARRYRIASASWHALYYGAVRWFGLRRPRYPLLDTGGYDVFIAQKPYAATVPRGCSMIVRYHDAVPVFMAHVIPEKSLHLATHIDPLTANVRAGAWFACVSEATRQDLLRLFPEVEARSATVHNMVSHAYHDAPAPAARVRGIVENRLYESSGWLPPFSGPKARRQFYREALGSPKDGASAEAPPLRYLLMVSTVEPRKNHQRLVAAWEALRAEGNEDLKLIVVGTLGWDNAAIRETFRPWLDKGQLFMLSAVPAGELRILYQHAAATVCPSLAEGFDYSGVEAMRSGGLVAASDLPVHREVYDGGAVYFDPYSTAATVRALESLLAQDAAADQRRAALRQEGRTVAARYTADALRPQWDAFLERVTAASPATR